MKVSYNWLNNFFDGTLPPVGEVADALTFHAFEIDGVDPVKPSDGHGAGQDWVLDVKITANRGHDCLSHRGIAKELSAILKLPISSKVDPFAYTIDLSKETDEVAVTLEDPSQCRRYIAGYIKGVKVGPSPEWLKNGLEAIGQRSINNVVDATNLVMFTIGQPMHAFDAGKLVHDGKFSIVVRRAHKGEKITTLDNKEYELQDSMLVIADQNANVPVGIAGVKGGMPAAITEATTDIILESANFDGILVRKTASALKLRTDASARYEQGLSPELCAIGMQQAVNVIASIAGGEVAGFVDVYPAPQEKMYANVTVEKVNSVLGTTLTGADIADVFTRLGFGYKEQDGVFEVQVPPERLDITIPEDLVEEVGRIVGYDQVPTTPLPTIDIAPAINQNFAAAEAARAELMAQGFSEVFTSVFADKGERVVLNKVDGVRPYLRNSLVPGLTDALTKNKPNKDLLGLKEIKLFEIGVVWKGGKEVTMVGTITDKQMASEKPLEPANVQNYTDLPLSTTERYQTFSRYPYIVRDVSMWLPLGLNKFGSSEFTNAIDSALAGSDLLTEVHFLDTFQKGDKTSFAFRLIFQSFGRTLTEIEVNQLMEKIYEALKAQGFEIR
ncbi:MAG TPA: phenylalanine--tRNA ligase subunit beta [Candidatus Paceibacterota bacterium]